MTSLTASSHRVGLRTSGKHKRRARAQGSDSARTAGGASVVLARHPLVAEAARYANAPEGQPTTDTALLSALMTEHYTLQSLRGSTIVEANGRGQLFLSTVSGATVALALVAQLDKVGDAFKIFAFSV
jgi:hypothetical protein